MKIILSMSLLFIASVAFAQEEIIANPYNEGGAAMPSASSSIEVIPKKVTLPVVAKNELGKRKAPQGKCSFEIVRKLRSSEPNTYLVAVATDNGFQELSLKLPLSGRNYNSEKKILKIEGPDEIAFEVHTDPYLQDVWEIDFRYFNGLPPEIICQEASS